MPEENELSHQNIKDRYYGTNDPVAKKILNRFKGGSSNNNVEPPEDKTIVCEITLFGWIYSVFLRAHCVY